MCDNQATCLKKHCTFQSEPLRSIQDLESIQLSASASHAQVTDMLKPCCRPHFRTGALELPEEVLHFGFALPVRGVLTGSLGLAWHKEGETARESKRERESDREREKTKK